ncbi:MAG: SOS response-associated peptidase, partial [Boseongicola sp. SB0670_bin_30]|nr:SOS response-associated peptidase [Boseongicola sp. SB0670_bin_30]
LINARAESIARKPAFRDACRNRRCLVPASGFYEWTRDSDNNRLPWYIHARSDRPLAFAGIWQDWERGESSIASCAIVTTSANRALAGIHHRMPVILDAREWPLWLGEAGKGAAAAMNPAPDDALQFHRVHAAVNSSRAKGAELVLPA